MHLLLCVDAHNHDDVLRVLTEFMKSGYRFVCGSCFCLEGQASVLINHNESPLARFVHFFNLSIVELFETFLRSQHLPVQAKTCFAVLELVRVAFTLFQRVQEVLGPLKG
jgi:hypothetical protein